MDNSFKGWVIERTNLRQKYQDYRKHMKRLDRVEPQVNSGLKLSEMSDKRKIVRPNLKSLVGHQGGLSSINSNRLSKGTSLKNRSPMSRSQNLTEVTSITGAPMVRQQYTFMTSVGITNQKATGKETYHRKELNRSKEILKTNKVIGP